MGLRGKLPLPAEIHQLRGNRSNRKPKRVQPEEENPVLVERPRKMGRECIPWWEAVVNQCLNLKTLRVSDSLLVWQLAEALERFHRMSIRCRDDGEILVNDKTGATYINPRYTVLDRERRAIRMMFESLGMTPSARTRLMNPGTERRNAPKPVTTGNGKLGKYLAN